MEKVYKIGKSNIAGKGLIAIKDLVAGDLVGMSHSGGQPSSEIGQYYNHSDSPNAVSQLVGDDRYVIASFPIKKGEEIVLDYREQPELEQPEDFINKAQDGGDPNASETNNSFLYNLEKSVNRSLGNVNQRAQDFSESEDEMANIDNMRHAMGGRYAAEAIQQKVSDIPYIGGILNFTGADKMAGFIGSNALGVGHELRTMTDGDDRPFFTKLQESGEDVFNNFVGSTIGSTNMTADKKNELIRYLSHNNLLPDGYVQSDEDFSDDVYFKNADGSRRQNGGSLPKAQDGKEVKGYFTSYLNSDLFKRRAIDLYGENEWENVRNEKLKRLEDTEVDFSGEEEWADIYATDLSKANLMTIIGLKEKFDRLQSSYKRPNYKERERNSKTRLW